MSTRSELQNKIIELKSTAQDTIRRELLTQLTAYTKRDTILYCSAFASSKVQHIPPMAVSMTREDIQGFMSAVHGLKRNELDLIIHSGGGSAEAAEQIVQYLRSKYDHIRVVVPQNAMSAATMLACAADEIVMGKQSAIGPIDPQITFSLEQGSHQAPAQAILAEFEQAKQEILKDPNLAAVWYPRIKNYPHGLLKQCEVACERAAKLVGEWLHEYHFRQQHSKQKATAIARWLSDSSQHLAHGRPINFDMARDKGLKVVRLEEDQKLQDAVLGVFHAAMVTFDVSGCVKFIENHNGRGSFFNVKPADPRRT